jgi:glycosyltransferase involved in cell wall biosynthesis
MVPFASSIINNTTKYPLIESYAIVIKQNEIDYKSNISREVYSNVIFMNQESSRIRRIFNKFYPIELLKITRKLCREKKIDSIHILTGDYTLFLIINKLKKCAKVYYTIHDLIPHDKTKKSFLKELKIKYIQLGRDVTTKKVENLVTCSKVQYEQLKKVFPQKKIYYHRFPSLITQTIEAGNQICPELWGIKNYILFFGFVSKYKGVENLYNAFINSAYLSSNYKLVIAGQGGWYFNRESDLEKNIIRIDRLIADTEVKNLYQNAACVVYPYISATQSGVLSLAYKFGVPLLVSDVDFFLQNVIPGKTAYTFHRNDLNDLAYQLIKLLSNKYTEEMRVCQLKLFEELYSEKLLLSDLEKIYKTINHVSVVSYYK